MTSSWVRQAIQRTVDYQRQDVCFLTLLETIGGVRLVHEPCHPLLRRPRIEITCPVGTDVDDIRTAFRQNGLESLYDQWWERNGKDLVEKGYLHE